MAGTTDAAPATNRCPRCGEGFYCGRDDAAPCPCTGVPLDATMLGRLSRQFSGCLCLRCLRALAADALPDSAGTTDPS